MPVETAQNSPNPPPKTWWVYMVRAANGHLYTGISTDPYRRFRQHLRGRGARFFNRSPAVALVWHDLCLDHSDALRREIAIKALGKQAKERMISQFDSALSIQASDCPADASGSKLVGS